MAAPLKEPRATIKFESESALTQSTNDPIRTGRSETACKRASLKTSNIPQRHKRYAPKVRTGCLTCKKRRVKCDETKPQCLKCLNSDYKCDGYAVPKPWLFEPSSKLSGDPAVQKEVQSPASSSSSGEERESTITRTLRSHDLTPDEARSFQFYLRRSGNIVTKYDHARASFWLGMLPQAAHRFESVKHSLIAIALEDELLTSSTTIPKIERRIAYHYQQSLQKAAYSKPSIDHILLNCLSMYYFNCLRDNIELIVLHIESARKILDEWRLKDEKVTPDVLNVIDAVESIVTEAQSYSQTSDSPAAPVGVDWEGTPCGYPYESVEDAEHGLIACLGNLSRLAGQTPLAIVRARTFLAAWLPDSRKAIRSADVEFTLDLAALFQISQDTINLLDATTNIPNNDRWFKLFNSLQEMPKLRSVKYRKPVTALVAVLKQRMETAKQAEALKALEKHLQRGLVYDG